MEELKRRKDLEMKNYKSALISDERMRKHLLLSAKDPKFIEFKQYMDAKCKEAVVDLYGKFSVLSSPILDKLLLKNLSK